MRVLNKNKILIIWTKGLGDIALGLFALNTRILKWIPQSKITYLTRPDLHQGIELLRNCQVISDPLMKRGQPYIVSEKIKTDFDHIVYNCAPTFWIYDLLKKLTPRLKLESLNSSVKKSKIAIHVQTETAEFYRYDKNWPLEKFKKLIRRLNALGEKPVLLGLKKDDHFLDLYVEDLRGEKSILEVFHLILEECRVLIAPDSGILSMVYYLDHQVSLKVISLWSDPNQGILKQGVDSPNSLLEHIYFCNRDLSLVDVESVFSCIIE